MKVVPLNDKIVVKRLEAEEKTAGGILLPDTAKEKPKQGKVLSVGDGKLLENGKRAAFQVKEGDRVLFSAYAGNEVNVDGEEYLIMSEDDVLAAAAVVEEIIEREPVVMFALEWCEFCWSVRKLFKQMGIAYRSVDVDSVKYQEDDLGGKIRAVLALQTGAKTLPQVFVGGEHIGGATDLFDAWRDGSLQKRLDLHGVMFDHDSTLDPYTLLPKWLQPRKSA
jgi:cysteine synthase A